MWMFPCEMSVAVAATSCTPATPLESCRRSEHFYHSPTNCFHSSALNFLPVLGGFTVTRCPVPVPPYHRSMRSSQDRGEYVGFFRHSSTCGRRGSSSMAITSFYRRLCGQLTDRCQVFLISIGVNMHSLLCMVRLVSERYW